MVLSNDQGSPTKHDSQSKLSPPQQLKLQPTTVQTVQLDQKKINLPTITVIDSSPIREYPPQESYAATIAHSMMQSNPSHALSESHPISSLDTCEKTNTETPTIEALIKATKATFAREEFKARAHFPELKDNLPSKRESLEVQEHEAPNVQEEDSNNNASSNPKLYELPPLKTLTITCPSSPLLQRHALMQAQKEGKTSDVSPPLLRRQTSAKKSPPMFRSSLIEDVNKSKSPDGVSGSLSPKLSRRFSGQGQLLGSRTRSSSSLDNGSKESTESNLSSLKSTVSESNISNEKTLNAMEVDENLDMSVRSGVLEGVGIKKPELKKNVTFSLETDDISSEYSSKNSLFDSEISIDSIELSQSKSVPAKSSEQPKSPGKERKKKGPLGIVMGKAAIAARAVSSGAHRSSQTAKQSVTTRNVTKPERKYSHSQCVMGTSVAQSGRTGHVSCATCGRRRAASQSVVASEPPTKQQAKGKQTPVRKSLSAENYPRKLSDASQPSKGNSPRDGSEQTAQKSKKAKSERKPFFV